MMPTLMRIPTPPNVLQAQQRVARQMALDMALYVSQVSLLDLFGEAFTRAQRYAIRDALRTVYLPTLANTN